MPYKLILPSSTIFGGWRVILACEQGESSEKFPFCIKEKNGFKERKGKKKKKKKAYIYIYKQVIFF